MSAPDTGRDFLDLPDRSLRPIVIVVVLIAGLAITGTRLFFALTDEDSSTTFDDSAVRREASDAATHPSAVIPDLEDLIADAELPAGPDGGLTVTESGVTVVPDRFRPERSTTTFAAVVDNPHAGWTATSVEVVVDLLAADGSVVHTARFLVPSIATGRPVAVAGVAPGVNDATRVDVALDVALWSEGETPPVAVTASEAVTMADPLGGVTSTVTVANRSESPALDVDVVVVYRRADGTIIGGFDSFVDVLAPGQDTDVAVDVPADLDLSAIADTDVYLTHRLDP